MDEQPIELTKVVKMDKHWTWEEAWGAERMRQARARRQVLHAQRRRRGIAGRGVEFFSPLHRLLYLTVVKMQSGFGRLRRARKIPLPERL